MTLLSDGVRASRAWRSDYDEAAERVPNLPALGGGAVRSYAEFSRLALPILGWSNGREPACRHYVMIHDSVTGGDEKETYKANLATVEQYFYKNLAN